MRSIFGSSSRGKKANITTLVFLTRQQFLFFSQSLLIAKKSLLKNKQNTECSPLCLYVEGFLSALQTSLKSSSSLFSFVSRLSFPLQNAVAMRNRPSQKYRFFTFRFIRAEGLPRCKVLAVPACRRMSALPPPPRPAASLPPSQTPQKYLCGWSPACGAMLRLPGSELHVGLLEKGMEEQGRDAETLDKGPAGTGSSWGCRGRIWDLATCSSIPAGMGSVVQQGWERGLKEEEEGGREG